jgi:hypothetical protein
MNLAKGGGTSGKGYSREHTVESRKLISEKLKDKTYEEIHGIESANLERDKRRQSVKNHWANMSDKDKADRVSKNIGKRYHHKKAEELKECPHCKIKARGSLLKRWHLDNCKSLTKL